MWVSDSGCHEAKLERSLRGAPCICPAEKAQIPSTEHEAVPSDAVKPLTAKDPYIGGRTQNMRRGHMRRGCVPALRFGEELGPLKEPGCRHLAGNFYRQSLPRIGSKHRLEFTFRVFRACNPNKDDL